jgi:MFS superfamily sulfate permease-like transporter
MAITGIGTVTISLEWAVLAGICAAFIAAKTIKSKPKT